MTIRRNVMTVMVLAMAFSAAHAAEPGQRNIALLSASCAACHGTNGHSVAITPSLAGMDSRYFIKQMQDFRHGERPSTVMKQHASGYTEEEIRQMAEFFSQQ